MIKKIFENISNKEKPQEWHKAIIKKFNKKKVHSPFMEIIWGADLADMQLIIKFDKRFRLLRVIDIYSKYPWVIPLTLFYLGGGGWDKNALPFGFFKYIQYY